MDINTAGTVVRINVTQNDEVRVNAADVGVTVTEIGRVLGGFVFTVGGSSLTIDDGGAVLRGTPSFNNPTVPSRVRPAPIQWSTMVPSSASQPWRR